MEVTIIQSCVVTPAETTFKGSMPLSEFDQIGIITHVPLIYFYKPSQKWLTPQNTIFETLHTSLSKVLVHFHPLAGRLRWLDGARLELDCNAKGVLLIEAYCDAILNDVIGDFTPSPDSRHLFPHINYSTNIKDIPLMTAQLTKFKCGGIALSSCISHVVVDGKSAFYFISEWARSARGEPVGSPPVLDRTLLRAGEPPLAQPQFKHPMFEEEPALLLNQFDTENERKKETSYMILKMSKSHVESLKEEANSMRSINDTGRAYSRYEAISGHIWRCACVARGHAHNQPTGIGTVLDVRSRLRPLLPDNFFGNAVIYVQAESRSGEVVGRPLSFACSKIREAIDTVTSEYVHSVIDFLKNLKDLSYLQESNDGVRFFGNPNIWVISWISLPTNGVDFGWGKEIFMSPGTYDGDGDGYSVILPGYDGLTVVICLQDECKDHFKKIFYEDFHN